MPYKNLHLDRDGLNDHMAEFFQQTGYSEKARNNSNNGRLRIIFSRPGEIEATVDLIFVKSGATTIQWKLGKNHSLGEELAQFLKETVDSDELKNVSLLIKGIFDQDINAIFDEVSLSKLFSLTVDVNDDSKKKVCVKSLKHQDSIVITHFKTTNNLQIQGRPLSSYKFFIYYLSELLDLACLGKVLYLKEKGVAVIADTFRAKDSLNEGLTCPLCNIPPKMQDLLISGSCVRLSAPSLPEYSLLLFPDLRALEGAVRDNLSKYGFHVDTAAKGFGDFFHFIQGDATLIESCQDSIGDQDLVSALNNGYRFLKKHRNDLFHMNDIVGASRVIDTLEKSISLSNDALVLIGNLYKSR